jgi:hypothetical protein
LKINTITILIIIIIVVIIIAIIMFYTRREFTCFTENQKSIYTSIFNWVIIIYALILTFTFSSFYQRFIDYRDILIDESNNLILIYRMIKLGPQSKYSRKALKSIREYTINVIEDVFPNLACGTYSAKSTILNTKMINDIITYTYENKNISDNPALSNILGRMTTDQKIKKLVEGFEFGTFLIQLLMFFSIFVIIGIWIVQIRNPKLQFIIDLSLLLIIFISIFLLSLLNNPFQSGLMTPSGYVELLNEIKKYKIIF